ncbi:metallo-dependent phosphatase [Phanerochaete sordida]|uniref:Metallo-dependent phosphatase n=1 Tax=Phanerochaete sordida TaxID=48140 RepID=A0A9P3GGN4_9APHY|nr:metallo-dependent phosphatase [Phanerochaete sordida]
MRSQRALFRRYVSAITVLRVLWALGVLWFDVGIYHTALLLCTWPDRRLSESPETPTHVLVIADAQVRHAAYKHSCAFPALHDWWYHAGLRRSWLHATRLDPHAVIFLGDMLAGARRIRADDEYVQAYHKFRQVFSVEPRSRVPVFYLPGNEDVGLNLPDADARAARHRYTTHFGPLNSQTSIANHTFVLVDAPRLVEEDYRAGPGISRRADDENSATTFVREVARGNEGDGQQPIVLFTHIPLSRPDGASCGPKREHGTLRRGAGTGYQNMHTKRTSAFLLETLQPVLVLSGDDRDYCEYEHVLPDAQTTVREVTVKSFSPMKSISRPGMHLLSLVPPSHPSLSSPTIADAPCFLPSQDWIMSNIYVRFATITLVILFVRRVRMRIERTHASPLPSFDDKEKGERRHTRKPSGTGLTPVATSFSKDGWANRASLNVPLNRAGPWRMCWRILRLSLLDFARVTLPALLLWAVVMWNALR